MSAPPAQGARVAWLDVPEPTRSAIEDICGAAVIEARTQPGGFSPGVAARVRCADETRWFVKAASAELNPDTPQMHRQEAKVLAGLDPLILTGQLPVPRLRGTVEYGPWFALIADDVDGRQPVMPWRDDELGLVLAALDRLGGVLTPAPVAAIYTKMIDAALEHPDDTVRDAVYPAVPGGVKTLAALARELKATERAVAERVRYQLRGSYSHYYRRMRRTVSALAVTLLIPGSAWRSTAWLISRSGGRPAAR